MRKKGRVDSNQKVIVKSLRQIPGVSVAVTSMIGSGFPDLVIGYKGKNYLIELKDGDKPESAQKLTLDEIEFDAKWKGQYAVCNSIDEILKLVK